MKHQQKIFNFQSGFSIKLTHIERDITSKRALSENFKWKVNESEINSNHSSEVIYISQYSLIGWWRTT